MPEEGSISIEQLLLTRLSKSDFKKWVDNSSAPYKELMAYYRCAIMEIETKFKVLNIVKSDSIKHELADCARIAAELDQRMEQLHTITKQSQGEKKK